MEPVGSVARGYDGRIGPVTGPARAWIAALDVPGALDEYAPRVAAVAAELRSGGVRALAVCRAVTGLHDALTVRLVGLAEAGLGPPPCPYAWLALGSGGRMEQSLRTDQDSAVVYDGGGAAAEAYFAALGARVVAGLDRAGLPRCPGGYMADRWRMPVSRWSAVFLDWVARPEPQALLEAEVFLDFRRVHGGLSVEPLERVLRRGCGAPRFLVGMARAAVMFPPPLGLAGRLRDRHREVDLKRGGLAAIVLLARLYALAAGVLARSTVERLVAAVSAGTLSTPGGYALVEAYQVLTELRLAAQLRQVAAGQEPTDRIRPDDLSEQERGRLRQAMHTVRDLQEATALRFRTDTVL